MTDIDKGGPAFPATEEHGCNSGCSGMSLREYAAIKLKVPNSGTEWLDSMIKESLRNEVAAEALQASMTADPANAADADTHARWAYEVADAMLKARKGGAA